MILSFQFLLNFTPRMSTTKSKLNFMKVFYQSSKYRINGWPPYVKDVLSLRLTLDAPQMWLLANDHSKIYSLMRPNWKNDLNRNVKIQNYLFYLVNNYSASPLNKLSSWIVAPPILNSTLTSETFKCFELAFSLDTMLFSIVTVASTSAAKKVMKSNRENVRLQLKNRHGSKRCDERKCVKHFAKKTRNTHPNQGVYDVNWSVTYRKLWNLLTEISGARASSIERQQKYFAIYIIIGLHLKHWKP